MPKKIKIMGFGTFDGIHPGHLSYFEQLRALGDEVYIVIARDKNVEKIKGRLPRYSEKDRLEAVQKTELADRVLLGNEDDLHQCIHDCQPTVIGLGYDQQANLDDLKKQFPAIKIVRLEAFEPEKHKSSLLS